MRRTVTHITLLLATVVTAAFSVSAQIPPRPKNANELVYDYANVLDSAQEQAIGDSVKALYHYNKAQVVVITVNSLEGLTIEEFSQQVFHEWGIGDKKTNNGVLIVVKPKTGDLPNEKGKVRIHTGYGAEGALPDLLCKIIQTDSMIPAFKEENYGLGIMRAINAIVPCIRGEYPAPLSNALKKAQEEEKKDSREAGILYIIIYLIFIGIIWYHYFVPTKTDGYSIKKSPVIKARRMLKRSYIYRHMKQSGLGSSDWDSDSDSDWDSSDWDWDSDDDDDDWGGGDSGGGGASSEW